MPATKKAKPKSAPKMRDLPGKQMSGNVKGGRKRDWI